MTENIVSRVGFIQPELLNEHFAILRRNACDNLVIRRNGDLLQFSASGAGDYIVEMTIQPDVYDSAAVFQFEPWNYDIITTQGKDVLKFLGKFKSSDFLLIKLVEVDYKRYNLVVSVNGIERSFDADKYEVREHSEWAYGIDAWLAADIRRDIGGVTETTHCYFADAVNRESKVYEKFGKRLKLGLKIAGKNEPRVFLQGTGLTLDLKGNPVVINTDGHMIYMTPENLHIKNVGVAGNLVPPKKMNIFLGYNATKALGDILTNKVLFKTTIPQVKVNPEFLEKIPKLTRFASIERITESAEPDESCAFAFKCTMIESHEMDGAAVFSFTAPVPLITHFRFLARQSHGFKYPDLTELMEKSLTLNDEERALSARVEKAEIERIIERLDPLDSVHIMAVDGELHIDAVIRSSFSEEEPILKSYEFFGNCDLVYKAWPEDKKIKTSVELLRKILSVIETRELFFTPILKEGSQTYHVQDRYLDKGYRNTSIAAMPVRG